MPFGNRGTPKDAKARAILGQLVEIAGRRYVSKYHLAAVHVALGEHDMALTRLEEACADKASWRGALNVDQRFLKLRKEPRFAALIKRMGL